MQCQVRLLPVLNHALIQTAKWKQKYSPQRGLNPLPLSHELSSLSLDRGFSKLLLRVFIGALGRGLEGGVYPLPTDHHHFPHFCLI